MGVTCRSDRDCQETLDLIGKRLQQDSESVTREALPTRWVELILYLGEQERESAHPKSGKHARVSEAERVKEHVLLELMRTEEPTKEAAELLKDLRRRVARAVAARHRICALAPKLAAKISCSAWHAGSRSCRVLDQHD